MKVRLTPRGAERVRGGHPWVMRQDVMQLPSEDVDEVEVLRGDEVIARALWAPPPAPIALRVLGRGKTVPPLDELLPRRLELAVGRRRGSGVTLPAACRLVHAEADGLPGLFVDKWGDAVVVQAATRAIDRRLPAIAAWLREQVGARLVVNRSDGSTRELEGLARDKGILLGDGPTQVTVAEGAARLEHDLLADAKTGGFLDQHANHLRVGQLAQELGARTAIDAFSHHGGFALQLAAAGCDTIAIEQDAAAAARIGANAARSGLGVRVKVRCSDAFAELRALEAAGEPFDVVVIDPPALAKRGGGDLNQAVRAYKELNLRGLRLTRPEGLLVTCSCSGKITSQIFGEMLAEAARDSGRKAVVLERHGAGPDHPVLVGVPETEYLKCWILRVME